jgi:hypothetical protein
MKSVPTKPGVRYLQINHDICTAVKERATRNSWGTDCSYQLVITS